jgi:hypothetical protein
MSSITIKGYINISVEDSKGGYQEPFITIQGIYDHINGHFVKPNKVALKYLNFKQNIDLNAHVKKFNFTMKVNAIFFE